MFLKKSSLFFLSLALSLVHGYSQEKNNFQLEKEKAKAEQKAYTALMVKQALSNKRFVVEANYLAGRSGNRVPVTPTLNFVMVDSTRITFQLGSPAGATGLNGVGGTTIDGRITNYREKTKSGKKPDTFSSFISLVVMTPVGTFDFSINAFSNGNGDVSIKDNFGNNLRYYGIIVPIEQSVVFKGMPVR